MTKNFRKKSRKNAAAEAKIASVEVKQVATLETCVGTIVEEFISSRAVCEKTADKYRRVIKQVLRYFEAKKIAAPTVTDIISYLSVLRAEKKSDYTLRLYVTVIKLFFKFLSLRGYYPNCAADVKLHLKKSTSHNRKALTQSQAELLISAVKGSDLQALRDKAIIALALTTGLRTIEISRADVADLAPAVDCFYLRIQGKGRITKDETVKIMPWVIQLIFNYLDLRGVMDAHEPLFASVAHNHFGDRLGAESISKMIKRTMQGVGINDAQITAHSTRHFAATCAIKQGVDLREVSAMLRHSNLNVTMIYLHDISLENREAEKKIAATLEKAATV